MLQLLLFSTFFFFFFFTLHKIHMQKLPAVQFPYISRHSPRGQIGSARPLCTTRHTVTAAHAQSSITPSPSLSLTHTYMHFWWTAHTPADVSICVLQMTAVCLLQGMCFRWAGQNWEDKKKKKYFQIFPPLTSRRHVCFILEGKRFELFKSIWMSELACGVARPRAFKAGEKCAIGEREKGETLQPDTNKDS